MNGMTTEETEQDRQEAEALREASHQRDIEEGRPLDHQQKQPAGAEQEEVAQPQGEAEIPGEQPQSRPQPQQPVSPEPEPEPQQQPPQARQRDGRGRYTSAAQTPSGGAPGTQEQPPSGQSEYDRAREREQKAEERKTRSWQALEEQKNAFRQQQAQWEHNLRMQQLEAQNQPVNFQQDGIDAAGYFKASADFKKDGDYENAMRAFEVGIQLQNANAQETANRQEAVYELAWRKDMESAFAQIPDLQNPETPIWQEVDRIVNQHPYLFYIPQGFHKAVEIAILLLTAGADSGLREENEQLRAEIESRNGGSQPLGSGRPSKPQGTPRQEDMSPEEEESYIRGLTSDADARLGY